MEPTSFLLLLSIPALIAGVALLVRRKKDIRPDVIANARARAKQRILDKEFAETVPQGYTRHDGVDYVTVNGVSVVEDGVNSHGIALTEEQMQTIGLIFQGYVLPAQHRAVNAAGPNVHMASGVPLNLSALDNHNRVDSIPQQEYLDPEYQWPEAHIRG